MQYKIIKEASFNIDHKVNEFLQEGWSLYGYPYCTDGIHYQAMIKQEQSELEKDLIAALQQIQYYTDNDLVLGKDGRKFNVSEKLKSLTQI
jgi:hypothetical protein